jgi:hypothetical protein
MPSLGVAVAAFNVPSIGAAVSKFTVDILRLGVDYHF